MFKDSSGAEQHLLICTAPHDEDVASVHAHI
jgi:hypothetical protein